MSFISNIDPIDALNPESLYSRTLMRSPFFYIPLMMLSIPAYLFAQTNELKLDTDEEIYKAACIGCHGPNGKGQPETTPGLEKPPQFPDFSGCNGTTPERG